MNKNLESAAFKGDTNEVKKLVDDGVEITGNVFSEASKGKRWNIVNFLSKVIRKTYTPKKIKTQKNQLLDTLRFMNDRNISDDSFLIKACEEGNFNVAKVLIQLGVDVNKTGDEGHTPLMEAVMWQRKNIVRLLIDNGADKYAKDLYGNSCIQMARKTGNLEIIELLF